MSRDRSGVRSDISFTLIKLHSKIFQTDNLHEESTKSLDSTVTLNDKKDWFLKVRSPIEESELNDSETLSIFYQEAPYICSECGKWLKTSNGRFFGFHQISGQSKFRKNKNLDKFSSGFLTKPNFAMRSYINIISTIQARNSIKTLSSCYTKESTNRGSVQYVTKASMVS